MPDRRAATNTNPQSPLRDSHATAIMPMSRPRIPILIVAFSHPDRRATVFARRCCRDTATLEGWMTCASTPRAFSQRANQKPSRPASKASAIRVIFLPALTASSRRRCRRPSSLSALGSSFFARLTLNAGKHTANQPTRLAHLDDGNDCAILVQGDEGPAQVVRLGHQGTPSIRLQRRWCHFLVACPIPSRRKGIRTLGPFCKGASL